ncbi:LamG domain-containing protein [Nocardioides marmoribigeumensis]|uniref:Fibronectin type-III domain-containing protein n=1 Tax=Nocardioides marmoribigeumensis TaxID=433649 RepID=A0ABU2BZH4_9ACTN|nr:LamG-like jellyroll fold domain-containing protein [Nocardioides marmoribigeumensis]MDR7363811.1 hypothetical protein [Nocardioides marmoribigeumensis]
MRTRSGLLGAALGALLVPLLAWVPGTTATGAALRARATDPTPTSDTRFTAQPLPTYQTNGVVYAVEAVGNVVYVGGNFTKVRPPGAAPGTREVARRNMAAFNATTGALLPFSHAFRAPSYPIPSSGVYDKECSRGARAGTYTCDTVYEIRASHDRSRIFVGGDFQTVDGRVRGNVAAFRVSSGALTSFRVDRVYGRVRALVPSASRLYIGGQISQVSGRRRYKVAAVRTDNGALTSWAPRVNGYVIAMAITADQKRVIIGGDFDRVNGQLRRGVRAVSAATGANTAWSGNPLRGTNGGRRSYVTDLAVDRDTVYVATEGLGEHVFDGRLAINPTNGVVRWRNTCLGATWAIERVGSSLYTGSHAHDCHAVPGGFRETARHLLDKPGDEHYHRFQAEVVGSGAPRLLHWMPTTDGGIVGSLGPRDLTYSPTADVLWAGGEFTTVNGDPQQGLTRFGPARDPGVPSIAPEQPSAPLAVSDASGRVRVTWEATDDWDNATLGYSLLRGGTVVATRSATSSHDTPRPTMSFLDTGLTPGSRVGYRVVATDGAGVASAPSTATTVTVASGPDAYRRRVLADRPQLYWPFDDQADRVAGTLVPAGGGGRYTSGGVTRGVPGALQGVPDDTAVQLDGVLGMARGRSRTAAPSTFSVEVWFKGSGTGKIVGYGSSQTTLSSYADRHLYVDTDGRLVFGMYDGSRAPHVVRSGARVDDDRWHHAVATHGDAGTVLYLDGRRVAGDSTKRSTSAYAGSWQVGGDRLAGWPKEPAQRNYAGTVDELAVYLHQLSPETVAAHHDLGLGG